MTQSRQRALLRVTMKAQSRCLAAALGALALLAPSSAYASGGTYDIEGGTGPERAERSLSSRMRRSLFEFGERPPLWLAC